MRGGELIREARKRAGLSQAELARRMHTKQPVIARWESLERSPSFENVSRAIQACGLELQHSIANPDPQEESLLSQWLRMTPKQRLLHNRQMLVTERWAASARRVERG